MMHEFSSRKFMIEADVQNGNLMQEVVMQRWMQLDKFAAHSQADED